MRAGMLRKDPNDLKPCRHMRTLVSAWIDGRLSGVACWYTWWHIRHCRQCRAAVDFLRALRGRLSALRASSAAVAPATAGLTSEQWAGIEAAWDRIDASEADSSDAGG